MVLNPKDYLTSQGWEGEGKGLQLNSRAKPITVLQKKDTFGIGKDRDHSYPWWDDVFKTVINKISVKKNDDNETEDNQLELRRTETGIISHLPSLPPMIDLEKSNLNLNAINDAKRNEAIQNLYRNFRRGQLIEGTVEELKPSDQDSNQDEQRSKLSNDGNESVQVRSGSTDRDFSTEKKKRKDRKEKEERKDKKEKRKKDKQRSSETTDTEGTTNTTETTNQEERKQKKDKKDRKEKKEKREKRKHKEPNQESKLNSIKKVIIDEGLNQIFTLDSLTKNERKMKRKSSKLERSEGDGESSRKKKRKKEE